MLTLRETNAYASARLPHLRLAPGGKLQGKCQFCGRERDCFALDGNGHFFCQRCGEGGSILDLEMKLTRTDLVTARRMVLELIGRTDAANQKPATNLNGNRLATDPTSEALEKPLVLRFNADAIPAEFRAIKAWVGWRFTLKNNKWTKVPVNLRTGEFAEADADATWVDFETAIKNYGRFRCDGIGLCRTEDQVFIDLDGVLDPAGNLLPFSWGSEILSSIRGRAYLEKSPTGTGIHGIGKGKLPDGRRQFDDPYLDHTGFAFYDKSRFFTFTGHVLSESGPIGDLTPELSTLHYELFPPRAESRNGTAPSPLSPSSSPPPSWPPLSDSDLIERAMGAKNGAKFKRLWEGDFSDRPSQSEADLALCCHLAFWTGRDAARIDGLFRQSALYRESKWGARQDYRERTINLAIQSTTDTYQPGKLDTGCMPPIRWLADDGTGGPDSCEWPDPLPLQSELPPVERFQEELLPVSFRPLARDIAERMQVPMDFAAASLVQALAGAVNRRATIQPKEIDTSWTVVPNLWGAIIGHSGVLKSPLMQAALRPLTEIQMELRLEHEKASNVYARAKEQYDLQLAAWKDHSKATYRNELKATKEDQKNLEGEE
jgi:hypothetical protein